MGFGWNESRHSESEDGVLSGHVHPETANLYNSLLLRKGIKNGKIDGIVGEGSSENELLPEMFSPFLLHYQLQEYPQMPGLWE